jgi:uncharacterized membrane protein YeaQ/YmgE (transglycosylase-associated protein family)
MAVSMLGMSFGGFLTLAVISLIAAFIVHYVIRYQMRKGFDGFLWKWVVGWVGAWLGSPVLGDWFHGLALMHIYIIPAFLGGFIGAFVATFLWKAEAGALRSSREAADSPH